MALSRRSHGALKALSRRSQGALTALSRRSHGALMALSRRSHGALTALSCRSHGALTALLRRSHGALSLIGWDVKMEVPCLRRDTPQARSIAAVSEYSKNMEAIVGRWGVGGIKSACCVQAGFDLPPAHCFRDLSPPHSPEGGCFQ
ncbi:hypothetical protein Bbelb_394720 [Branchiostoma belcheri]|nr:hypothetical protein Bbelb_394720 [Branchiostoma belcheri]